MGTLTETHQVEGTFLKETDKAVLISIRKIDDTDMEFSKDEWFPKSQILDIVMAPEEETPTDPIDCIDNLPPVDKFTIKHWILDQKGLV